MKNSIGLTIFILLLLSGTTFSQVIRNTVEADENREEIRTGSAQLERDIAEIASFKAKLNAFELAFENRNIDQARVLKVDIISDMHREIAQSERKIAQDREEVGESNSELNTSRRETRRSQRDMNDNGTATNQEVRRLRDDRRDQRDDRRDVNDDKSDLEHQMARTARQKYIINSLKAVSFSFDETIREQVIENKKLIHEFVRSMEADITATRIELTEDNREADEDRRERREDRRTRIQG